ncbi:response regulator receiver protein [Arthrobacter agilis]|uniref:Response regulator receiver protein n=1 Tax=Arthrobacter agilis TaxID=37921 RepID=A0A2L0UHU2_9MICC|nr:GAF and ANTAR domain-containing protein [Arthrobacter agilis]AUZ88809.1 response regulator receiver protein [Arthrobacter agilis]
MTNRETAATGTHRDATSQRTPNDRPDEYGTGETEYGTGETSVVLQNLVLDSPDVEEFLTHLARFAAERLSGHDSTVRCGVTLLRPRKQGTAASSDQVARRLDELQNASGNGPCLEATRTETRVYVRDVADDDRWPEYFTLAHAHGVRSILAVPVLLSGEAAAALNLYADTPDAFGPERISLAQQFADEASQGLRLAVRIAHLTDTGQNLTVAMTLRTTIDLAAGIIMSQNTCSQHEAMTILKAAASARNRKLRDLAAAVVASVSGQAPVTHFEH